MKQINRPVSSHLSSYKPQITSINSIFHRISGFVLSFILLCLNFFVIVTSSFVSINLIYFLLYLFSLIFVVLYFIVLMTFFFHLLNGVRHLFWDFCLGLDIESITKSALLVIFFVFVLIFIFIFL